MPIQTVITLENVITRVLSRLTVQTPDIATRNYKQLIKSECNLISQFMYDKIIKEMQPEEVYYRYRTALTIDSGTKGVVTFLLTSFTPPYYHYITVERRLPSYNKISVIPYEHPEIIRSMESFNTRKDSPFFSVSGDRLLLYLPVDVDNTGLYFFTYYRRLEVVNNETDYIDLPTHKIDELVNNIIQSLSMVKNENNQKTV